MDFEEMLKKAGERARLVKYATEEDFIEKAKKMAAIQPGDIFYAHYHKGARVRKCVFIGWDHAHLKGLFLDEDHEMGAGRFTPACVTFPGEKAVFSD